MNTDPTKTEKTSRKSGLKKVAAILIALIGIASLATGATMLYMNSRTDNEGYSLSNSYAVRTNTHAYWLRISSLEFVTSYSRLGLQLFGVSQIAQTKWVMKSTNPNKELFVGLASASTATNYLNTMETEGPYPYWEWFTGPFYAKLEITTTKIFAGLSGPTRSPAEETIWINSAHFKDKGTIYWDPYWVGMSNDKYLVIMNLDGTSGVQADIELGIKTPLFGWLQYVLVVVGLLLCFTALLTLKRR